MKKAFKYLETRPDYVEPIPDDWMAPGQEEEEINYGKVRDE